ncbi:MAG: cell envelope biogenesis protein OmpA [Desulfovibrio sp.]|nr:cell envelope biogenesis protein OmpA [Desulfovibrio sp.]
MKLCIVATLVVLALGFGACTRMTPTQQGALSGAAIGAAAGAGISAIAGGNAGVGALLGGGLCAVAGTIVGNQYEYRR